MKGKIAGRHKFMCAVDGMVYYSEDKRIRWDGAIVCKKNLEPRQPQELIKSVKEDTRVPDTRDEKGRSSDQANNYEFIDFSRYPTFALVDENNTMIVASDEYAIQVPPNLMVLA